MTVLIIDPVPDMTRHVFDRTLNVAQLQLLIIVSVYTTRSEVILNTVIRRRAENFSSIYNMLYKCVSKINRKFSHMNAIVT